jgi:hypothetical protein
MKIVVNHVTRMQTPRVCVAGFDPLTLAHIRPTSPPSDPLTRKLLREEGGPFGMGALVDVGSLTPDPSPPETEDHRFDAGRALHKGDLDGDLFLEHQRALLGRSRGERCAVVPGVEPITARSEGICD